MPASKARWLLVAIALLIIGVGVVLWRYTPLSDLATPAQLAQWIGTFKGAPWAPFAVIGGFMLGGLLVLPLVLLIAATALVFDPLVAIGVSFAGALASAALLYGIGAKFTRGIVEQALGSALRRVSGALENRGIFAIAALRMVPVAPYSLINLAAGSLSVRFADFMIGTALGIAPGAIMITAFGSQLQEMWRKPTPGRIAVFIAIVIGWFALSWGLQKLTSQYARKQKDRGESHETDNRGHDSPRP